MLIPTSAPNHANKMKNTKIGLSIISFPETMNAKPNTMISMVRAINNAIGHRGLFLGFVFILLSSAISFVSIHLRKI